MEFSVVIPTYNRLDVLPEVLEALEQQEDAPDFEIVVVDDGSTDGTTEWLRERPFRVPAAVLSQPNRGPAAARNLGSPRRAASGWPSSGTIPSLPQDGSPPTGGPVRRGRRCPRWR